MLLLLSIVFFGSTEAVGGRFALIKESACIGTFLDSDYLLTTANCVQDGPKAVGGEPSEFFNELSLRISGLQV